MTCWRSLFLVLVMIGTAVGEDEGEYLVEVLRDLESSQSEKSGKVQPLKTKWSVIAKVRLGEPFEVRSRREHELMIVKGVVSPDKDGKFMVTVKCRVTSPSGKVLTAPGVYEDLENISEINTQVGIPAGEHTITVGGMDIRGNQQVFEEVTEYSEITRYLLTLTPYVPLED